MFIIAKLKETGKLIIPEIISVVEIEDLKIVGVVRTTKYQLHQLDLCGGAVVDFSNLKKAVHAYVYKPQ